MNCPKSLRFERKAETMTPKKTEAEENTDIFARIHRELSRRGTPLIVGVNGAYTSGKTMIADGLQAYLRAQGVKTQLLHYDDFHNPFSSIEWDEHTEIDAFYNRAFNPEKLVRDVLQPFREEGSIKKKLHCIDLGTGEYTNMVPVDADEHTVLLLEGVLLFRAPLLPWLDYKIYLDIGREEILRRARLRDVPRFGEAIYEKFLSRYIPVQLRYVQECKPEKQADLVIDNNDWERPVIVGPAESLPGTDRV